MPRLKTVPCVTAIEAIFIIKLQRRVKVGMIY